MTARKPRRRKPTKEKPGVAQSEIVAELRAWRLRRLERDREKQVRLAVAQKTRTPDQIDADKTIEAREGGPGIYVRLVAMHPEIGQGDLFGVCARLLVSVPITAAELSAMLWLGSERLNAIRATAHRAGKLVYVDAEGRPTVKPDHRERR